MTSFKDQFSIDGYIKLGRLDINVVTQLNQHNIVAVPNTTESKKQKFIIGGTDGSVTCYELSTGNTMETIWKTDTGISKPVLSVSMGGLKAIKDQIYILCDNQIIAFRKAGVIFFRFKLPLADRVERVLVDHVHLHCFGKRSYSLFNQATLKFSYTAPSDIVYAVLASSYSPASPAVICCSDGVIRVLNTEQSPTHVHAEFRPRYAPTVLAAGPNNCILYGTATGEVGCVSITREAASWTVTELWSIRLEAAAHMPPLDCAVTDSTGSYIASRITCLSVGTFLSEPHTPAANQWARVQFAVGTVDGTLSVLRVEPRVHADTHVSSQVLFQALVGEEVLSAIPAHVAATDSLDILVYTRGGRLVAYSGSVSGDAAALVSVPDSAADATLKPIKPAGFLSKLTGGSGSSSSRAAPEAPPLTPAEVRKVGEDSIRKLQADIAALTSQIAAVKGSVEDNSLVAIAPKAPVSLALRVTRIPHANAFRLVCESEVPLDMVALESTSALSLQADAQHPFILSAPEKADSTPSQLTVPADALILPPDHHAVAPPTPMTRNGVLASFRCAAQARKVECRFRIAEGQACELVAHAIMKTEPKRSQVVTASLKPLCLHELVETAEATSLMGARECARVSFRGDFLTSLARSWLASTLPDVPPAPTQGFADLAFRSQLDGSVLMVTYGKGRLDVHAESLYTCSVLRDMIMRLSSADRVQIDSTMQLKRGAVTAALDKAKPFLQKSFVGAQQLAMAELLKELQAHEPELDDFLDPELALLLEQEETVRQDMKTAAVDIEIMVDGLRGLLGSIYKLKGRLVDLALMARLEEVLTVEKYDFVTLSSIYDEAMETWGGNQ